MVGEACDEAFFTLVAVDPEFEPVVSVDLVDQNLELALADEDEGFGLFGVPDVVAGKGEYKDTSSIR
jgi:hypothetical protein